MAAENKKARPPVMPMYQARDEAQVLIDAYKDRKPELRVLDAGCGSVNRFEFGPDARIVGIDVSQRQLDNKTDIHEKILGDIQTFPLEPGSFDFIVCWNVLEHVPWPHKALENFRQALAPGGMMILTLPNLLSVTGLVTRFTPLSFHIWFLRNVTGPTWAGTDHRGPFKTYMRISTTPPAIRRFVRKQGLKIRLERLYEGNPQIRFRRKYWLVDKAYAATGIVKYLTLGSLDPRESGFLYVIER